MENLVKILLHLVEKAPGYISEADKDGDLDLLRAIEKDLGVSGIVPPATGPSNLPVVAPAEVPVPGPVATPVPAAAQPAPPRSPELTFGTYAGT